MHSTLITSFYPCQTLITSPPPFVKLFPFSVLFFVFEDPLFIRNDTLRECFHATLYSMITSFYPCQALITPPSPHDLKVHLFCQVECYIPCLIVQEKERDENKQQQLLIHTCMRCFLAPHTAKVNEGGNWDYFQFCGFY